MQSVPEQRAEFAEKHADRLARQVTSDLPRLNEKGWTKRAVWYGDESILTAVVSAVEGKHAQEVLAHALSYAGKRRLNLVLPESLSGSTETRIPWLSHEIDVYRHDGSDASRARPVTKAQAIARAGDFETSPPLYTGDVPPLVRQLERWASSNPDLEPAHRAKTRGWSHRGQRVLEISGRGRATRIKAGIDAKADPVVPVKGSDLTSEGLTALQRAVAAGMSHAERGTYQTAEEHHLQARLAQHPYALGLEHPLLREVPAFRPGSDLDQIGRAFIDLVGLDGHGDVVVVETKLVGDHMIVLQGLDYWLWAMNNKSWLITRLNASPHAELRLLFAVAGKKGGRPSLSMHARTLLKRLDPEIDAATVLIDEWTDPRTPIVAEDWREP